MRYLRPLKYYFLQTLKPDIQVDGSTSYNSDGKSKKIVPKIVHYLKKFSSHLKFCKVLNHALCYKYQMKVAHRKEDMKNALSMKICLGMYLILNTSMTLSLKSNAKQVKSWYPSCFISIKEIWFQRNSKWRHNSHYLC